MIPIAREVERVKRALDSTADARRKSQGTFRSAPMDEDVDIVRAAKCSKRMLLLFPWLFCHTRR